MSSEALRLGSTECRELGPQGEGVVTGSLTLVSLCSSRHSSSETTPSITTRWEPFKTLEFMVRRMPS